MAGYVRDFLSIEQALKAIIKDIKNEGFKEATGKSESHFRKCSDVTDENHHIHHQDSIDIDRYCATRGMGTPMLDIHEAILEAEKLKNKKIENVSETLITIGARIGKLMDTTQKAIDPSSQDGKDLSQSEKDKIHKAIREVEAKILKLKYIVDMKD